MFLFFHVINRLYISAPPYEFDILMKLASVKIMSILGLWDGTPETMLESVQVRSFLNIVDNKIRTFKNANSPSMMFLGFQAVCTVPYLFAPYCLRSQLTYTVEYDRNKRFVFSIHATFHCSWLSIQFYRDQILCKPNLFL
jgi:hypothetical protein